MKILMISSFLPFPLTSGGHIRLYNLIKNLGQENEITLVCEKRNFQSEKDVEEVEKICKKVITVERRKQWNIANVLKTGFSTNPFLVVGHTSDEFKQAIKDEMVRENFDLIHVETFYVYQNLPKVSIPVVLVEHNIEYLVYERFARLANPLLRPLFYADIYKLKRKEEKAWKKATKLVAVSRVERNLMKRADVYVVPNGVNTENFRFRSLQDVPEEKRILFIGDFKWLQNRDSLEFIITDIWPKVLQKINQMGKKVDLKLWVVGKNIPDNLKNLSNDPNIIFDENNKDEAPQIFRKSFILLAPLRAAGGTSYKILEAFSSGAAVVTTNLGIEGLEAKNEIHVLASDESDELANLCCNLLFDHSLYRKITLNARKFVEDNYDWKIISKKLNEVYMSTL